MIPILAPHWLARAEPGWPEQLEHLRDPPDGLWMLGHQTPRWPAVAIVGSRRPTLTGVAIARGLARDLAAAGVQVVSGFARGIDAAAHQGAIEGGGTTIAILGCGLNVAYPRGHERLRHAVIASGALITEDGPEVQPEGWRFPRRNRLIAALSAAVIVVEAAERSGALSTARWAADLGRDVLAVPGSIRSDRSRGTNLLIRDGARPLLSVADVFEVVPELAHLAVPPRLGLAAIPIPERGPPGAGARTAPPTAGGAVPAESSNAVARTGPAAHPRPHVAHHPDQPPATDPGDHLELPLREILDGLGSDPVHPDDLGATLGLAASVVASRLTALELQGAVQTLAGGLVARTFQ